MRLVSFYLTISFSIISVFSFGQVSERSQTVNGTKISGYFSNIGFKSLDAEEFYLETLKEISKPKKKRDFYELENLKLGNVYYPEVQAYSRLIEKDSVVGIWIGIDESTVSDSEEEPGLANQLNEELKGYFDGFEEEYFIFTMNRKIEDAEQAVAFTQKGISRMEQDNEGLADKLLYKESELQRYKDLVEKTQLEVYSTEQQMEKNRLMIQESEIDVIKMKKLIEDYRAKIN